ncbi:MAG: hypothetical protein A2X86_16815 [Bdellovibrionales bacterium GWA2_49_15]|nr:MAG: hypothetical protein A2X86_16815 [Bdellovibrionales bacterium GWA2_49_15]HAZ12463.1 hypothetical protein [Bdellovibrionales bacterium]
MFIFNTATSFFTMLHKSAFLNLRQYGLPLTESEAMAFSQLDRFLNPGGWTYQDWQQLEGEYLVCAVGSGNSGKNNFYAGVLLGTAPQAGDVAHLLKVVVEPELRRQGGAKLLLEFYLVHLRLSGARSVYLEVATDNLNAISFYRKHGFKDLRVMKKFYQNGADALSMELVLS